MGAVPLQEACGGFAAVSIQRTGSKSCDLEVFEEFDGALPIETGSINR
jgi:hypothetical protein